MNWILDDPPKPDYSDYWVGVYEMSTKNVNDYLAYAWVKEAKGSFYIGKLKTKSSAKTSL